MLDTLQKMSGTTHRVYKNSKTVTRDMERIWMQNEGKMSYTMSATEVPVITYNDMAFIAERNSIVFSSGVSPIWNRNETVLPMSWRLFQNTIEQPGKEYTLQTIPTLSSAIDFDIRKNQPDFIQMWEKRRRQAKVAKDAMELYQKSYGYTDYEMSQLDPDIYADEIMQIINQYLDEQDAEDEDEADVDVIEDGEEEMRSRMMEMESSQYEVNTEQLEATKQVQQTYATRQVKRYCDGQLSSDDLVTMGGAATHIMERQIVRAYLKSKAYMWRDTQHFSHNQRNELLSASGEPYITRLRSSKDLDVLEKAARDPEQHVFMEESSLRDRFDELGTYQVTDAFYRFLANEPSWRFAQGRFERELSQILRQETNSV